MPGVAMTKRLFRRWANEFTLQNLKQGPVVTRGHMNTSAAFTGVAQRTGYVRLRTPRAAGRLQVVWGNWNKTGAAGGENVTANTCTLRVGIELPADRTKIYQATFAGQTSIVVNPGQTVISDEISGLYTNDGDFLWVRTEVTPAGGAAGFYPGGYDADNVVVGEGASSAALAFGGGTPPAQAGTWPSPATILGNYTDIGYGSVAIIGDSIAFGSNDGTNKMQGYIVRALNDQFPYTVFAVGGEDMTEFRGTASNRQMPLICLHTHAVLAHGSNDFYGSARTFAQAQEDMLNIAYTLRRAGLVVCVCTVIPRVTQVVVTPGDWSEGNQAIIGAGNAERVLFNNWLRGLNYNGQPFSKLFDVASKIESLTTSGKFQAAYMDDAGAGTHPNAAGHTAMATAINTAAFRR